MNQGMLATLFVTSFIFGGDLLDNYDGRFESNYVFRDTTDISNDEQLSEIKTVYPARSLVRSLIIPGWGQIYNKSPWWKPVLFAGVEVAGIAGWVEWNQKAERLRLDYENFADDQWSILNWITFTQQLSDVISDSLIDWEPDVKIEGTHHLDIVYNDQIYSSDCLYDLDWSQEGGEEDCILPGTPEEMDATLYNTAYIPSLIENGSIIVIKDRDYYENIGKYDQFVAGWDGILGNYIIQYKDVGDTTEIIISSPIKGNYLSQREKSNEYLNMATYAVSAVMFNHIISAFEAVWSSTRQSIRTPMVDTSVKLIYDKHSQFGIGGVSFSVRF